VTRVRAIEQDKTGSSKLAEAVARHYHKLLAYKDEYEVARLHADDEFGRRSRACSRGITGRTTISRRRFSPRPTR
jgi:indolepyruvate ferredoxin oxidoreductase